MHALKVLRILREYHGELTKMHNELGEYRAVAYRDNKFWHKDDVYATLNDPSNHEIYFKNLQNSIDEVLSIIRKQLVEIRHPPFRGKIPSTFEEEENENYDENEVEDDDEENDDEYIDDWKEHRYDIWQIRCMQNGTKLIDM